MRTSGADLTLPATAAGTDVTDGEESVARAEVAFAASLKDASHAGRALAFRALSGVRPVLIGAGLLIAAAITLRLLTRSRGQRGILAPSLSEAPTLVSQLGGAVLISFASVAGRRLAERWVL